jgi:two-component system, probable response regulator PhcQ
MQDSRGYQEWGILYVDDEEKSLKYFARTFESTFRIFIAPNAAQGFEILQKHRNEIAILISDQRMPGESGVDLLERARVLQPRILRILVTAFSELDVVVQAVNSGAIYKYLVKPWNVVQVEMTLRRGLDFFIIQRERDQLLREKLTVLRDMMITDRVISLGVLAAGLNHHIRNSLVAVRTFLDLLPVKLEEEKMSIEKLRNPNFWSDFYGHVQGQIERITGLLSDLSAASGAPNLSFQDSIGLEQELREILEQHRASFQQKGIEIQSEIPEALPRLTVDRWKFRRLFELLLADELASLPAGTRITLRARAVPALGNEHEEVQIELEDNGPGLPTEALRSVFDPFFLRKENPQEYGINLMTCYFLVYHHGGKIEVKSPENKGTVFLLTFPTQVQLRPSMQDEKDFLSKALLNETLWEKLLAGN